MAVVNAGTAITKALTKIADNSTAMRTACVTWFNEVVRDILNQPREWFFLQDPTTLAIASNSITLPAGYSEIVSMQVGDVFLTPANQISEEEAFDLYNGIEGTTPEGYTLKPTGVITFYPGATGSAILTGEKTISTDYADNADTIFPLDFENVFIAGVRMNSYDYTKDGRYTKEVMIYQDAMNKVKRWDNTRKAIPNYDPSAYVRTK